MKKPKTIDEYLKALPAGKGTALLKLRRDIAAAAPKAQECVSYGIPGFRLNGKYLLGFGATARHCAFLARSVFRRTNHCRRAWCAKSSRRASRRGTKTDRGARR